MKTLDLTPSWEAILPAILLILEEDPGREAGKEMLVAKGVNTRLALEYLKCMARLADKYVAMTKEIK